MDAFATRAAEGWVDDVGGADAGLREYLNLVPIALKLLRCQLR
jgi:hypothetical protein